jgi:hypothetical protein
VPGLTDVVVEAISNAFGRLPDPVLLPWLPTLISTLRASGTEPAPLIREAGRIFPGRLAALDEWVPPWRASPARPAPSPVAPGAGPTPLVQRYPDTAQALHELLDASGLRGWRDRAAS